MSAQRFDPHTDAVRKVIDRYCSRHSTSRAAIAQDMRVRSDPLYNMLEARQQWKWPVLYKLYHHMKATDRLMTKRFLQALFDDDEITIPGADDIIRDKLCSLAYQTLGALERGEIDDDTARAIANEAERFGATVKRKARE